MSALGTVWLTWSYRTLWDACHTDRDTDCISADDTLSLGAVGARCRQHPCHLTPCGKDQQDSTGHLRRLELPHVVCQRLPSSAHFIDDHRWGAVRSNLCSPCSSQSSRKGESSSTKGSSSNGVPNAWTCWAKMKWPSGPTLIQKRDQGRGSFGWGYRTRLRANAHAGSHKTRACWQTCEAPTARKRLKVSACRRSAMIGKRKPSQGMKWHHALKVSTTLKQVGNSVNEWGPSPARTPQ